MTNEEKITRVRAWQSAGYVHPLTCGTDTCRADLDPVEEAGKVILRCSRCGYRQTWIPEVCFALPTPPFSGGP